MGQENLFESLRKESKNIQTVSADFVQEKHLPILAKPLISKGRMFYRRPNALRWEYTFPVKSIMIVVDGDTRRFVHSGEKWVEDDGARLQAMQFVMPEISSWISGNFRDNPMFSARQDGENKIVMTPKDSGMARFIQRIELTMGDRPGVIDSVVMYEDQDAFTRMSFKNTRINPALDFRLFKEVQ